MGYFRRLRTINPDTRHIIKIKVFQRMGRSDQRTVRADMLPFAVRGCTNLCHTPSTSKEPDDFWRRLGEVCQNWP